MKWGILIVVLTLLLLVPNVAWAPPPGTPVTVPIDADTLGGYHASDLIAMITDLQEVVLGLQAQLAYIRVENQPINGLAGPDLPPVKGPP